MSPKKAISLYRSIENPYDYITEGPKYYYGLHYEKLAFIRRK